MMLLVKFMILKIQKKKSNDFIFNEAEVSEDSGKLLLNLTFYFE